MEFELIYCGSLSLSGKVHLDQLVGAGLAPARFGRPQGFAPTRTSHQRMKSRKISEKVALYMAAHCPHGVKTTVLKSNAGSIQLRHARLSLIQQALLCSPAALARGGRCQPTKLVCCTVQGEQFLLPSIAFFFTQYLASRIIPVRWSHLTDRNVRDPKGSSFLTTTYKSRRFHPLAKSLHDPPNTPYEPTSRLRQTEPRAEKDDRN